MKFLHMADLHIGKRVNEYSMLEDQAFILQQILEIANKEQVDGLLVAGDVYDKSLASAEAVQLFDHFLSQVAKQGLQTFVISGNHDSAERIAYGGRLMKQSGVYMSPVYGGEIETICLQDDYGKLNLYMLPFVKPPHVRRVASEETEIETYTDAIGFVIGQMQIDTTQRNILLCHQFVAGALRTDSEEPSVGGLDAVDASVFEPFDYVALGHLHRPQKIGRETVRYAGSPLKYSFSEISHQKSVVLVEFLDKGTVEVRTIPLQAKRDLREIKGRYETISSREFLQTQNTDDYVHIILTDEEEIMNVQGILSLQYPNMMRVDYDNARTRAAGYQGDVAELEHKTPLQLFGELFELQNGQSMSKEQEALMVGWIEEIWSEEEVL